MRRITRHNRPNPTRALLARDEFTDTNGTILSAHTPTSGGSWTRHPASVNVAEYTINSAGRVYAAPSDTVIYLHSAVPQSPDYGVYTILYAATVTGNDGVIGRADAASELFYFARYNSGSARWELLKFGSGGATTFATSTAYPLAVGDSARLGLEMRGSEITLVVGDTPLLRAVDTELAGIGRAGMRSNSAHGVATGLQFDQWWVESLPT